MYHGRSSRVHSELGNRRDIKMHVLLQVIYTVKAFDYKKYIWFFQEKKKSRELIDFFFLFFRKVCIGF